MKPKSCSFTKFLFLKNNIKIFCCTGSCGGRTGSWRRKHRWRTRFWGSRTHCSATSTIMRWWTSSRLNSLRGLSLVGWGCCYPHHMMMGSLSRQQGFGGITSLSTWWSGGKNVLFIFFYVKSKYFWICDYTDSKSYLEEDWPRLEWCKLDEAIVEEDLEKMIFF